MIEVSVKLDDDQEVGKIVIEKVADHDDGTADYSVRFAVDRVGAVGLHQRQVFRFNRHAWNALALVRIALSTLEESELRLEHGTAASDLARRQRGARLEISREATDSVRHHRSSFWRR